MKYVYVGIYIYIMLPYLNKHRKLYEIVISYKLYLKNVRMITTWWFEANNLDLWIIWGAKELRLEFPKHMIA
jgi:hypothetical protein